MHTTCLNRLITLGLLLVIFSVVAGGDWSCKSTDDCINGDGCRGGECACKHGWATPDNANGPCNVDTIICDPNPCKYDSNCTVVGSDTKRKVVCECVNGTSGDRCNVLDDNCEENGNPNRCQNNATCTNKLNDYQCTCVANSNWAGKTCEAYSYFSVMSDQQVVFAKDFLKMDVKVFVPAATWHTLILMLFVELPGGDTGKVTLSKGYGNNTMYEGQKFGTAYNIFYLRALSQDGSSLNIFKEKSDSDTTWHYGGWNSLEVSIIDKTEFIIKANNMWTMFNVSVPSGAKLTKVVFGGCSSNDASGNCSAKSDVYYGQFVGAVKDLTLDNAAKGYESGAHKDAFTCDDLGCANNSSCIVGVIPVCECKKGTGGTICDQATQITFNGYISEVSTTHHYIAKDLMPLLPPIISFSLDAPDSETAVIAKIKGTGDIDFSICLEAGLKVLIMTNAKQYCTNTTKIQLDDNSIVQHFYVNVTLGGSFVICKGPEKPQVDFGEITITLGGDKNNNPIDDGMLLGCVSDLSFAGQPLTFATSGGSNVRYDVCKIGICSINTTCGGEEAGTCAEISEAPYYNCTCKEGYVLPQCSKDLCYQCRASKGHESCEDSTGECTCKEEWTGEFCSSAATKKSNTQTLLIVVVVSLLVFMFLLIGVIFTVRRCNRNKRGQGTYSPNKAELEMGATPQPKGDNIYKNSDVIENVNAESKLHNTVDVNDIDNDMSYNIYNDVGKKEEPEKKIDIEEENEKEDKEKEEIKEENTQKEEDKIPLPPPLDAPEPPTATPSAVPPSNEYYPEPPTPLNVTMDTVESADVTIDISKGDEIEDSNRLSQI